MKLTTLSNTVKGLFRPKLEEVSTKEQAWAEDLSFYSTKDFEKYNPDSLIGSKGHSIYRRMMIDEQIKAVVKFKRDAITARGYDFIFSSEAKEELSIEEQQKRRDLFHFIVRNIDGPFIDKLNGVASGMYQGFSLTEKILAPVEYQGKTWVGVEDLKLRPYDTFTFHVDDYGNVVKLVQKRSGEEQELDLDDFIHYVHNPEIDEHYGQSDLREAYRAWYSKDIIIKMQNIFLTRYAAGFVWATIEGYDNSTPEYAALQAVLTNIQTKTAIIVPEGVELHIESPKTTDAYERAVAQQDKAIAKALLVPNLIGITEQGDVGSYSQSETQLEAFLWTLDADANRIAESVDEDLFRKLGDLNWGDGFYPEFQFKPLSETMKIRIVKLWNELVKTKAITQGEDDEDHIRTMLDFPSAPKNVEDPNAPPPVSAPGTLPPTPGTPTVEEPEEGLPDETIIGKESVKTARQKAFSKAMQRVDFTAIDRGADVIAYQQTDNLTDATSEALRRTLDTISLPLEAKDAAKVKLPADATQRIRAAINASLKDGWKLGQQHAKLEVNRAERAAERTFTRINMQSIGENAARYFDAQSFILAGEVSDKLTQIIKSAIMTGIQYDKTADDIIKDIYQRAASKGVVSKEDAEKVLGDELKAKVPNHMLETIVRTSSFNALNEARFQYFQDPALEGFVEAFEYSAILDSRTTDICNELGGADGSPHVHAADWEGWEVFRPPNHYNCRSLLIPVTVADTWEESGAPMNYPQEGFA